MSVLATLRFKLMFAWAYLLRITLSYSAGNNLASKTIPLLHPRLSRQKKAFIAGLIKIFPDNTTVEQAWQRHKLLVGLSRFQSSFYAQKNTRWIKQCEVEIHGAEYVRDYYSRQKGVLVMTYHHHLNMLFCNLLGRLTLPVTTIAMDAQDSRQYQKFGGRVNRVYEHAEKHLNGGDIILVKPQRMMRSILRAFDKNHLVISANDFPEVFDDKNRKEFSFLGTSLSCPTGTVKLAVRKKIPIVAAYLNWLGGSRFELVIRPVSDGSEEIKVKQVMSRYLSVLELAVQNQPGIWEGWKWIK